MRDNICYQENHRTEELSKDGRAYSSKITHPINVQYLFVTKRIKADKMKIEYWSTMDMIGDYPPKPLTRSLLQNPCNIILGIEEVDIIMYNTKAI